MVQANWNGFKAFGGTLNSNILQTSPDVGKDIKLFYDWLLELEADPESHGIPETHIADVATIFQSFLIKPAGADPASWRPFLASTVAANPVIVKFGPDETNLQLVDGASALGYLFSIVEPPVVASWDDYWWPMLIFFSKCLYLAFAVDHEDKSAVWSGVPIMANIMYLPDEPQSSRKRLNHPLMFGASIPFSLNQIKRERERERQMVCVWRRDKLLADALERSGYEHYLPDLPEISLPVLAERLNLFAVGRKDHRDIDKFKPLFEKQTDHIRKALIEPLRKRFKSEYIHPMKFISDTTTQAEMESLLYQVIKLLYAPDYQSDSTELAKAYKELLQFYLTPRVLREGSSQAESLNSHQQAEVTEIVDTLWPQITDLAIQKLTLLKEEFSTLRLVGNDSKTGHCAEAYPSVGLGSHYFPIMENKMGQVRGIAVEARGIGRSKLFNAQDFSLDTLKRIPRFNPRGEVANDEDGRAPEETCCRYPCENCRVIMRLFGIRAGYPKPTPYDKDMEAADVSPH